MAAPATPSIVLIDGTTLPDRTHVGGKAWSIANMRSLGLSVPPAFVIPTPMCRQYFAAKDLPASLVEDIDRGVRWLEQQTGRQFGRGPCPLLVSVRSGAAMSMPGMMDTVLNLGICDDTEGRLAQEWSDPVLARDVHRRFWQLFGKVVLRHELKGVHTTPSEARAELARALGSSPPPVAAAEQLLAAVRSVFDSWNSPRAKRYRKHQGIGDELGTAVTVQAMVFGNADAYSGTGVLFSRNPLTGERAPYGEYLARAQGEDVVSGSHTPLGLDALGAQMPDVLRELLESAQALEMFHRDAQDIEFTVERRRLYFLQTRAAKRAPYAALRIAESMVEEGLIDVSEALGRVTPEQVRLLLTPRLAEGVAAAAKILARGEPASPGIGQGRVVPQSELAESMARAGTAVVLARSTTSPEDLHGMLAATATVTDQGGTTSHAAVVARALGKPCVVGCGLGTQALLADQQVTVDGSTGVIYEGKLPVLACKEEEEAVLSRFLQWAERSSPVRVVSVAPSGTDCIDFDQLDNPDDLAEVSRACAAVPPGWAAAGKIFSNSNAAMIAALDANVTLVVTYPRLPALLAATRHRQASAKGNSHVEAA